MPIYVIYNRKTGEVVQTHFQQEELKVSREWLQAMTDPKHNQEELEVKTVDPGAITGGRVHRMDAATGKLQAVAQGPGFGVGGARPPAARIHAPTRTVFDRKTR